jgi:hypothetical protein
VAGRRAGTHRHARRPACPLFFQGTSGLASQPSTWRNGTGMRRHSLHFS